jgi:hypothetical protein
MPIIDRQNSQTGLPKLTELCTHMGTLWPWHRPVYDSHGNGHVRIEFRAIPAGPSTDDMAANAAFAIGLAAGMAKKVNQYTDVMPFRFAEYNFYRAAQHGLDAHILWPLHHKYRPEEVAISAVLHNAIDIAAEGLASLGVSTFDIEKYLGIIEHRISGKINGATWQKKRLFALSKTHDKDQASQLLVKEYLQHCRTAMPLATWEQNW